MQVLWYLQASPLLPGLLSLQNCPQCPVSNHHQWLQMKHDNLKQFIILVTTHSESDHTYWQCLWRQHVTSNHHCSSVAFRGHIRGFFFFLMFQCYFWAQGVTPAVTHLLPSWTLTPDHSSCPLFTLEIKACQFLSAKWRWQYSSGRQEVWIPWLLEIPVFLHIPSHLWCPWRRP